MQSNDSGYFGENASGFATCLAIIVTFIVVPGLHDLTGPWIHDFIAENYGEDPAYWLIEGYYYMLFPTVFFALRGSMMSAFIAGAMFLAMRFL